MQSSDFIFESSVCYRAGEPNRDLWLSPDHAIYVDDVLIPIRHLIDAATIVRVPMDTVTYYHIELPRHDIVIAEGLPAESYLDIGNRSMMADGGDAMQLHPDFAATKTWRDDAAATLANYEAQVRLMSRAGYATDSRPWLNDLRLLGMYVGRIIWHAADGPYDMPIDDPALREGWWDVERSGHLLRRWTCGDALLPCPPDVPMVEVHHAGIMHYRVDTSAAEQLRRVSGEWCARNEHVAA